MFSQEMNSGPGVIDLGHAWKQSWQKQPMKEHIIRFRYLWDNSIEPALISISFILLLVGAVVGVGALGIYLLGH